MNEALETLKNQITWIEYVPEHELTDTEQSRVIISAQRLIKILKKLNHKYND